MIKSPADVSDSTGDPRALSRLPGEFRAIGDIAAVLVAAVAARQIVVGRHD